MVSHLSRTEEVVDLIHRGVINPPRIASNITDVPRQLLVRKLSKDASLSESLEDGEVGVRLQRIGPTFADIADSVKELKGFKALAETRFAVHDLEIQKLAEIEKQQTVRIQHLMENDEQHTVRVDKLLKTITLREVWNKFKKTDYGRDCDKELYDRVKDLYASRVASEDRWKADSNRLFLSDEVSCLRRIIKQTKRKWEDPMPSFKQKESHSNFLQSIEKSLSLCEQAVVTFPKWDGFGHEVWKLMQVGEEGNSMFHDEGVTFAEVNKRADDGVFVVDGVDLGRAVKSLMQFLPDFGKAK